MASAATELTRPSIKVRPEGFTVLHECAEPEADIILIHGLQGHPKKTWLYKEFSVIPKFARQAQGEKRCYWPFDLLPLDFAQCRILVYGYDSHISRFFSGAANKTNILGLARAFLDELEEKRRTTIGRPLVLVAHSLGGLLLKAVLRQSSDTDGNTPYDRVLRDICASTIGTIFLGTPHRGSDSASLGEVVANVARLAQFDASQNILKDLRVDATILEILDESFSKLYLEHDFMLFTFEEGRGLGIPLLAKGKIVPSWSAHLGFTGEQRRTINANHRKMCRFQGPDSPGYGHVRRAVVRCLAQRSGNTDNELDSEFLRALSSLETPETSLRFQQVSPAHDGTYEWVFTNEDLGFLSWLQSDSPLYWIKGKPASGKSTLMKFAVNDQRVRSAFKDRPGKSSMAAFFFHDRGSHLQKSLDGLLQEILSTVITDIPELKPLFCKVYTRHRRPGQQHRDFTWDRQITIQVLAEILQQDLVDISLIFFLDALDEYSGKLSDIAKLLLGLKGTNKTLLKICFSSRPEQIFLDSFPGLKGFSMHDYTRNDIKAVIDAEFGTNLRVRRTLETDDASAITEIDSLKTEIGHLCKGVFLWVRLVLEELLEEYTNGANLQELRATLENVPRDLDNYYEHLVDRIDRLHPDYRSEREQMFEILRSAQRPLSLAEFYLAFQLVPVTDLRTTSNLPGLDAAARRINTRCGALIEIQSGHDYYKKSIPPHIDGFLDLVHYRIQFLHQTVKTWRSKHPAVSTKGGRIENGDTYLLKMSMYLGPSQIAPYHLGIHEIDNLLLDVSRAETSTGSSVFWIICQFFLITVSYQNLKLNLSPSTLAAFAAARLSLEEALLFNGEDQIPTSDLTTYILALYTIPCVSYHRDIAEVLLSNLPQPREPRFWGAISKFISVSSQCISRNDAVDPSLALVDLCQLAVGHDINTSCLFHVSPSELSLPSELGRLDPGSIRTEYNVYATILHRISFVGSLEKGSLGTESFMVTRLEIAKILLGTATNINILDAPRSSTPLDVAIESLVAVVSNSDWETSIVDKRGYLDGILKLCTLLIDHGGMVHMLGNGLWYRSLKNVLEMYTLDTTILDRIQELPLPEDSPWWSSLGGIKRLFSLWKLDY